MRVVPFVLCALVVGCASEAGNPTRTPASREGKDGVARPNVGTAPRSARPWGDPVPGEKDEQRVLAALTAVGAGTAEAQSLLADVVMVGPALWVLLTHDDGSLKSIGTPAEARLPNRTGGAQTLEMRAFLKKTGQVSALLKAQPFRQIAAAYANGRARAATEPERKLFYAFIPFEIAGKPLTIVVSREERLVAVLANGQLMWIDLLSAYTLR
jgi:hypothetical protein